MPAFDYSQIYDLYDAYCTFTGDVGFWTHAADRGGDVLELMAGTGRVSLPLAEAGVRLTCLEHDYGMTSVLAEKVRDRGLPVRLVCGDVTSLPSAGRFRQILLPFQGLSELARRSEREALFQQVAQALEPRGQFLCTSHNPAVRSRALDGHWQPVGTFPKEAGQTVEVSVRGLVGARDAVVDGEQRVLVRNESGEVVRQHTLPLRFALPPVEEVRDLARRASLREAALYGGYDRSSYDAATSSVMIAVFEKTA